MTVSSLPRRRLASAGRLFAFLLFALCVLSPYLTTGYYQDDSINSLLPAILARQHQTIGQFIGASIKHWSLEEARFFPLTLTVSYSLWYWVRDLTAYRLLQVGAVLTNLLLFMSLIRAFGGERKLARLSGLLTLGLFQLRDFHDPITSYALIMQAVTGLGMTSLLLLRRYRITGRGWMLAGSLAAYAALLLYYEAGFAFIPLLFMTGWWNREGTPLATPRGRWSFILLTGGYFSLAALLRLSGQGVYTGTRISLTGKALWTFFCQLSAALPLTYPFFGKSGIFPPRILISPDFYHAMAGAILLAGYLLARRILDQPREAKFGASGLGPELQIIAWTLVLAPCAMIAVSQKYQNLVGRPGIGYLPVYLSYFGIALLLGQRLARVRKSGLTAAALAVPPTAFVPHERSSARATE